MKLKYVLSADDSRTNPAVFEELIKIYPEGLEIGKVSNDKKFFMKVDSEDHPAYRQVLQRLEELGCVLTRKWVAGPKEIFHSIHREYETSDFENSKLLELNAKKDVECGYRDAQGRTQLGIRSIKGKMNFASYRYDIYVPTWVKVLIEESDLIGPRFVETIPCLEGGYGEDTEWKNPGEEWWELTSDLRMPQVSPTMDPRTSVSNEPIDLASGNLTGLEFKEGFYSPVEYHYTAKSLRKIGNFDLALTSHHFSMGDLDRPRICSQRFYRFCIEHKLNATFQPVRIDQ